MSVRLGVVVTFLLAQVLLSCGEAPVAGTEGGDGGRVAAPVDAQLEAAIAATRSDEYWLATMIASGHGVVRSVIVDKPEHAHLVAGVRDHPAVLRKALEQARGDRAAIPILVALGDSGEAASAEWIAPWLRALPDGAAAEIHSPWHPFRHALVSLEQLRPALTIPERAQDAFHERKRLADALR